MPFTIEPYSSIASVLGEGPHWSERLGQLLYVSPFEGKVYSIDNQTKEEKTILTGEAPLSVVLPVVNNADQLVVASKISLLVVNTRTNQQTLIDTLDKDNVRLNDAKCDVRGRIWIGTYGVDSDGKLAETAHASLYLLNSKGKLTEKLSDVAVSNGMCWSHDSRTMYYVDSFKYRIHKFDYDIETGDICNNTILVNTKQSDDYFSAEEVPDGMTIDVKGNLWVAMFKGSRVVNIDGQSGRVIQSIQLPVSQVTSVCFGGPNLNELYVTTAYWNLDQKDRETQPLAGYVFKITSTDSDFRGFKANYDAKL